MLRYCFISLLKQVDGSVFDDFNCVVVAVELNNKKVFCKKL